MLDEKLTVEAEDTGGASVAQLSTSKKKPTTNDAKPKLAEKKDKAEAEEAAPKKTAFPHEQAVKVQSKVANSTSEARSSAQRGPSPPEKGEIGKKPANRSALFEEDPADPIDESIDDMMRRIAAWHIDDNATARPQRAAGAEASPAEKTPEGVDAHSVMRRNKYHVRFASAATQQKK